MAAFILIALVAGFGYFASLKIHPFRRCPACQKTPGRHWGSVYSHAYRRCRACGGTGRKYRLGAKIFLGNSDSTGGYGPR
ncbi:MAG TPA: hypothetical protein VGJ19_05805 [Streptosporangiaceae bacterium]|jgi:hypothetical protein